MPEPEPQPAEFSEIAPRDGLCEDRLDVQDLREVRLHITADLGRTHMTVRDVLVLKRGSLVTLDCLAGEMTDIYVNGLLLARGEVVVIGDSLHVRIGEIRGLAEKKTELQSEDEL